MSKKKINYKYWASLDKWTQKEAALLMDGKDPDEHQSVRLTFTNPPPGYENAARIAKAISRTDWAQRYGRNYYSLSSNPLYIVDALLGAGWAIPEGLKEEIQARFERDPIHRSDEDETSYKEDDTASDDERQTESSSSARSKERNTMLKLILGLACGGYGMDPTAEKNRHAKSMREDLERLGIPLDDGTIKKYLDEAKRLRERLVGD